MLEIFKDCDNICFEKIGRTTYVCSLSINCNRLKGTDKQLVIYYTDKNISKGVTNFNDIIFSVSNSMKRGLFEEERELIKKRLFRKY